MYFYQRDVFFFFQNVGRVLLIVNLISPVSSIIMKKVFQTKMEIKLDYQAR